MTVILIKYKLVCEVTVDGQQLGYITDKEQFETSVENFINQEEENKVFTTIEKMPEYKLAMVDRKERTNEELIFATLKENSETTYKFYAVTIDGKEKARLANLDEAEKLVKELNTKYQKELKIDIAITEFYTKSNNDGVTTVKTAKEDITKQLTTQLNKQNAKNEVKKSTKTANTTTTKVATTKTTTAKTANVSKKTSTSTTKVASLKGVKLTVKPVSGTITSRFGSRESIRNHGHKGLDIGAPKGTKIKAAGSGTVTFSGYNNGGYGYLVIISHGNGIETYYAHCSKLYVSKGQKVSAGDVIAAVGSTGNSTGNHLHFEVVKNGVKLNPQNYVY